MLTFIVYIICNVLNLWTLVNLVHNEHQFTMPMHRHSCLPKQLEKSILLMLAFNFNIITAHWLFFYLNDCYLKALVSAHYSFYLVCCISLFAYKIYVEQQTFGDFSVIHQQLLQPSLLVDNADDKANITSKFLTFSRSSAFTLPILTYLKTKSGTKRSHCARYQVCHDLKGTRLLC